MVLVTESVRTSGPTSSNEANIVTWLIGLVTRLADLAGLPSRTARPIGRSHSKKTRERNERKRQTKESARKGGSDARVEGRTFS